MKALTHKSIETLLSKDIERLTGMQDWQDLLLSPSIHTLLFATNMIFSPSKDYANITWTNCTCLDFLYLYFRQFNILLNISNIYFYFISTPCFWYLVKIILIVYKLLSTNLKLILYRCKIYGLKIFNKYCIHVYNLLWLQMLMNVPAVSVI